MSPTIGNPIFTIGYFNFWINNWDFLLFSLLYFFPLSLFSIYPYLPCWRNNHSTTYTTGIASDHRAASSKVISNGTNSSFFSLSSFISLLHPPQLHQFKASNLKPFLTSLCHNDLDKNTSSQEINRTRKHNNIGK